MPYPICTKHAARIYSAVKVVLDAAAAPNLVLVAALEAERADLAAVWDTSVVYYIRIHDFIKIGTTVALEQRRSSLRVDRDAVLATEPGDRRLESMRHKQFAAERIGRRENFEPSDQLMSHIAMIRKTYGDPVFLRDPYEAFKGA